MNLYIFKDINLTEGIFCQGNKVFNKLISDIPNSTDILFVLPNELLQHVYFEHNLKNKGNIHAKIINDLSSLKFKSSNLEVLDAKNDGFNYFVIEEGTRKLLKNTFSKFNQKVCITSDLLFFKESFNEDIQFENFIYLNKTTEPVKLSLKSFELLDSTTLSIKNITNQDLKKLNTEQLNFYEFNAFSIKSLFNFSNMKNPLIVASVLLIAIYGAALANINSNYAQVNKMNETLASIYSSIYPNESITNITTDIQNKLLTLNNADKTQLTTTIEIISMVSQTTNIIDVYYSNELLTIKCLFKNDAEESIFINQQNRLNYSVSIKDTESNQLGRITTIEYDL
tara:strand:- start:4150 stop:5169 length:1020 start_codon:yes stop_codon:yes gene_type:complete